MVYGVKCSKLKTIIMTGVICWKALERGQEKTNSCRKDIHVEAPVVIAGGFLVNPPKL